MCYVVALLESTLSVNFKEYPLGVVRKLLASLVVDDCSLGSSGQINGCGKG